MDRPEQPAADRAAPGQIAADTGPPRDIPASPPVGKDETYLYWANISVDPRLAGKPSPGSAQPSRAEATLVFRQALR